MTNKQAILIGIVTGLIILFMLVVYVGVLIQEVEKNRCSDAVLKDKILNLGKVYTDKEKTAMLPKIREWEGCR